MTTYNIRKLTAEFAKEQQQQVQLSQKQQQKQSSPYFQQTSVVALAVPQYQYQPQQQQQYQYKQQATATTAETMYDEPVSYVSPVVLEVHSQEAEQFHFSTSTSTSTATSTQSALLFERPSFVTAAALSPVISALTSTPLHQWTYNNNTTVTQQQTQTPTQGHRQQQTQAHEMTRFMFSPSMPAVQVHTPPTFVAQHNNNNNYHYSSQQQQQQYGQANDWGRDPTLSPLSQDIGLGSSSNLADLSDLDNSPVLSGYDAHELSELLKTGGYNFAYDGSDNSAFNFINSLVGNDLHHQHNHVVPAPPHSTPATTIMVTPHLAPCSPLPISAAAAAASMHFHMSSPTPTPLSPPCVPYSPSVPFMIPSNLFQYTLPPCSISSSSSLSSSSSSGTGSMSSPIVKPFSSSSSSFSATQRPTTLKAKSRKRTTKPRAKPDSSSSYVSDTNSSPATPVVSSIPYFDLNNEKRFRCAWPGCLQEFERHHNCKAHYSTHTGERHFKCTIPDCLSKSFRQKGDLTRHMRIHTNERPYPCGGAVTGCNMTYGRCDQKAKHEKKCSHFLALGQN